MADYKWGLANSEWCYNLFVVAVPSVAPYVNTYHDYFSPIYVFHSLLVLKNSRISGWFFGTVLIWRGAVTGAIALFWRLRWFGANLIWLPVLFCCLISRVSITFNTSMSPCWVWAPMRNLVCYWSFYESDWNLAEELKSWCIAGVLNVDHATPLITVSSETEVSLSVLRSLIYLTVNLSAS